MLPVSPRVAAFVLTACVVLTGSARAAPDDPDLWVQEDAGEQRVADQPIYVLGVTPVSSSAASFRFTNAGRTSGRVTIRIYDNSARLLGTWTSPMLYAGTSIETTGVGIAFGALPPLKATGALAPVDLEIRAARSMNVDTRILLNGTQVSACGPNHHPPQLSSPAASTEQPPLLERVSGSAETINQGWTITDTVAASEDSGVADGPEVQVAPDQKISAAVQPCVLHPKSTASDNNDPF